MVRPFAHSSMYSFYRQRQLDGTMDKGSKYGSHVLTTFRVYAGWGLVSYRYWPTPRGTVTWPPTEPVGLDRIARFNRFLAHFRVRTLDDAKYAIAYGGGFVCQFPITRSWRSAPGGMIEMPRDPSEFVEHHAVQAIGHNDATQRIRFSNNWGAAWGDNSSGYLPYEYLERYTTNAWFSYLGNPRKCRPDRTDDSPSVQRKRILNNAIGNPSALIDLWNWDEDVLLDGA